VRGRGQPRGFGGLTFEDRAGRTPGSLKRWLGVRPPRRIPFLLSHGHRFLQHAASSCAAPQRSVRISLPESVRKYAVRFANDAFPDPDDTRRAYATAYVVLYRAGRRRLPWTAPDIIGLIAQRLNATDDASFGAVPSWVRLDGMLHSPPSEPDGSIRSKPPGYASPMHTPEFQNRFPNRSFPLRRGPWPIVAHRGTQSAATTRPARRPCRRDRRLPRPTDAAVGRAQGPEPEALWRGGARARGGCARRTGRPEPAATAAGGMPTWGRRWFTSAEHAASAWIAT
jgi:hypothetical protein